MEINKLKIVFFLRTDRKLTNNESPIYMRAVINSERVVISANKSVTDSLWDKNKQRAKGNSTLAKEVNTYLELIRTKLYYFFLDAERNNRKISSDEIKKLFASEENNQVIKLLDHIKQHIEKLEKLKDIDYAPSTIQRYKSFYKILENFLSSNKQSDIQLNEWSGRHTNEFLYYLKAERKCMHNSAAKYIRTLGKILREAIKAGLVDKSETELELSIKWVETNTEYLTKTELQQIIEKDISVERIQIIRDLFVFCCFTGLSFIDLKQLTKQHIQTDNEGKYWIMKNRQKTDQKAHIPLLEIPLQIIAKYEEHPYCIKHKVLLPVMSNQNYNAYLKELAAICSINKNLVSHMARHTFATTVTLANNISMESVSRMLGHSDIKMTKHYAKILDETVGKEMKKLDFKEWKIMKKM